jgi:hypothetical protein
LNTVKVTNLNVTFLWYLGTEAQACDRYRTWLLYRLAIMPGAPVYGLKKTIKKWGAFSGHDAFWVILYNKSETRRASIQEVCGAQ